MVTLSVINVPKNCRIFTWRNQLNAYGVIKDERIARVVSAMKTLTRRRAWFGIKERIASKKEKKKKKDKDDFHDRDHPS